MDRLAKLAASAELAASLGPTLRQVADRSFLLWMNLESVRRPLIR